MHINKLLYLFRGALKATVPWITKAGIKWKDKEAYDDWETIAAVLYENIVCSALAGRIMTYYSIPAYDLKCKHYKYFDFIAAYAPHHKEKLLAFVSFASIESPLDKVRLTMLDDEYNAIEDNILYDLTDLTFFFNQLEDGKRKKSVEIWINT